MHVYEVSRKLPMSTTTRLSVYGYPVYYVLDYIQYTVVVCSISIEKCCNCNTVLGGMYGMLMYEYLNIPYIPPIVQPTSTGYCICTRMVYDMIYCILNHNTNTNGTV